MQRPRPHGPHLDTEVEPWVGTFPGLGRVEVSADGSHTVVPEDGDEFEERRRALTHGWAEPLSFARRGFQCVLGEAVAPDGAEGCLLLSADAHDGAALMLALHQRGWRVLANRLVPVTWEGPTLTAHPNPAPILVSAKRAAKLSVEGEPARAHTDALLVECARAEEPLPVVALLQVGTHKTGDPEGVQPLTGHRRFEFVASLFAGGMLRAEPNPSESPGESSNETPEDLAVLAAQNLAENMRLAKLPAASLRFKGKGLDAAADSLVAWWESLS